MWRVSDAGGSAFGRHWPAQKNQQARKIVPMGPAFISLFFFLPLGIVALIFAAQFKSKLQAGDYNGAESAAGLAKMIYLRKLKRSR